MRSGDLADSPLASTHTTPADAADSPLDHVAEPLIVFAAGATYPITFADGRALLAATLPLVQQGVRALEASGLDATSGSRSTVHAALTGILDFFALHGDRNTRIQARCIQRRFELRGQSLDAIGKDFGVCRAAIQSVDQKIRAHFGGHRCRADKPERAREQCRQRRIGARKLPIAPDVDSPRAKIWKSLQRSLPRPR